jgi:MYXO-CTERM domain-containing protein
LGSVGGAGASGGAGGSGGSANGGNSGSDGSSTTGGSTSSGCSCRIGNAGGSSGTLLLVGLVAVAIGLRGQRGRRRPAVRADTPPGKARVPRNCWNCFEKDVSFSPQRAQRPEGRKGFGPDKRPPFPLPGPAL